MAKNLQHYAALIQDLPTDGDKRDVLIREIYEAGCCHEPEAAGRLEFLGYLDKVLWVRLAECCGATVPIELTLSIVAMFNETARCGRLSASTL